MEEDLEARLMEILFDRVVRTSDMGALFEIRFSANNPESVTPGEKFTLELEYSLNSNVVQFLKKHPNSTLKERIENYLRNEQVEFEVIVTKNEALKQKSPDFGNIGNMGSYMGYGHTSVGRISYRCSNGKGRLLNGETITIDGELKIEKNKIMESTGEEIVPGRLKERQYEGQLFLNAVMRTNDLDRYCVHFLAPIASHQVTYNVK